MNAAATAYMTAFTVWCALCAVRHHRAPLDFLLFAAAASFLAAIAVMFASGEWGTAP